MEITGTVEWDEVEDREFWNQFLRSRTGSRLIPKAIESCPVLLGRGETNDILIRSGEVRGFQLVIQALLALSVPEPKTQDTTATKAYPALDDDAAWADGKKVNPEPE